MNTRLILLISTLLLGALGTACIDADGPRELYEDDLGEDAGTQDMGLDSTSDMLVEPDMALEDSGQDQNAEDQSQPGNCVPNRDGVIERDEVTLRAGLNAKFKVSTRAEFNTAPEEVEGESVWDLSGDFDGDSLTIVELQEPDSFWFSADFPDATYVTQLSADSDLLGIFKSSETGLELLGVASPEEGFTQTKLKYDPPVEVLKFPIEEGSQWETESSVSGTALGVFSLYDETYVTHEAGQGILKTPFADFPLMRQSAVWHPVTKQNVSWWPRGPFSLEKEHIAKRRLHVDRNELSLKPFVKRAPKNDSDTFFYVLHLYELPQLVHL